MADSIDYVLEESERRSSFVCNICNQSYTRVDHLSRHYRSHTREKPFSCSLCGKNFARTDLLKRHSASHTGGQKAKRQHSSSTQVARAAQACSACASAKLKCGDDKPCRRCLQKGIDCTPPQSYGRASNGHRKVPFQRPEISDPIDPNLQESLLQGPDMDMVGTEHQTDQYLSQQHQHFPAQTSMQSHFSPTSTSITGTDSAECLPHSEMSATAGLLNDGSIIDIDDSSLADFLQDIMTRGSPNFPKDSGSMDFSQAGGSWDVFNFATESSLEFNDMDLGWITSTNHQSTILNYGAVPDLEEPLESGQQTPDVRSSINLGAEAFQKSLWNWLPGQREHGWMELSNLSLPHKDMEGLEKRATSGIIDSQLEQSSRDAILAMVLKTNSQESGVFSSITSFPSAQLLNSLMHLFFRSEVLKTDSWIHFPTFRPRTQRPEFNGMVIAAGAILSSVPTVRKLGFAIQETVRLALPVIFEKDNSRTRELQVLQTYALELHIGLWSGNKRKMEIAESHAQPLITMLRRAGHYRRSRTLPAAPEPNDDDQILENKWRAWVEVESFKRLAFHLLIHDAQASISLLVRPLISYSEVSLELPCSPSLWLAPTAQAWRTIYLQIPGHSNRLPSLMNCVHDLHPLVKYHTVIDVPYSATIILHSIWSLIFEYRGLEFVLKLPTQERHWNGGLISSSWHHELSLLLSHFTITISECSGEEITLEQTMIKELFMMNLHVSFEELQLFAGKEGNEEAQRVYPLLKQWFENRKSRQAVWHAGQVIRAAVKFPLNQLRDFYAVALYHASLAIWVYGMVSLGSSRSRSRKDTNLNASGDGVENEVIFLDGEDTPEARRFIALSKGVPAIHQLPSQVESRREEQSNAGSGVARLDNPKAFMEVVIGILTRNCTAGSSGLALLIENLAQLVRDLGNAARIVKR